MSDSVETVKVATDSDSGFYILNKSDFDPKVHKLYKAPAKRKVKKA